MSHRASAVLVLQSGKSHMLASRSSCLARPPSEALGREEEQGLRRTHSGSGRAVSKSSSMAVLLGVVPAGEASGGLESRGWAWMGQNQWQGHQKEVRFEGAYGSVKGATQTVAAGMQGGNNADGGSRDARGQNGTLKTGGRR